MKNVIVIGAGLGGLATALRLATQGYQVQILEKNTQAGGRLNQIILDGHRFDLGPSFLSMSYDLRELYATCRLPFPHELKRVDPVYQVFFRGRPEPFRIWQDFAKLDEEFASVEPGLLSKLDRYLAKAKEFYVDTDPFVIRTNFDGLKDYAQKLLRVPRKHLPYLLKNMWQHAGRYFSSDEVRVIMSLVAFFLGDTPFHTPAVFSLLNYIEMKHDGYWIVDGGMYRIVEEMVATLKTKGVLFDFQVEVTDVETRGDQVTALRDKNGRRWSADIYVCNADAASFRGLVLKRKNFSVKRLDRMHWSMAPFTLYLGVEGKIENLLYHNYFLGSNFNEYAKKIFRSTENPEQPYYYVNVVSKAFPDSAPAGTESVFVLCPVPDLRFKKSWADKEALADNIIKDMSGRSGFDFKRNMRVYKILTPEDWADYLNLYRGSGLGLCHDLWQVGGLRPKNRDEQLNNLYYVGASTIPGTGLPMVVIGSKLVTERITHEHGFLS